MRKHRWFALLLAGMMAVLVAVPGWNLAAAKAEATAELPVWQQPFEETVTLDVVIGWDADPSIKEGTTPETNALRTVAKDLFNIELNFLWMVPKDMGYNMIIFLAAITNVDPALNESAALDGANRWHQTWHITLPTIRPIIVMLLVLALGTVFSAGQEQIMLLYNPMVYESSDIIDTLVYRTGLVNHQWSLSAAVGMMKSVISFLLVAFSYRLATKHFDYQVF